MKEITKFSDETAERLGYYVYRLIDPRNGRTFYVGKGKGNRVFEHIKCALKENAAKENLKYKIIKEIKAAGLDVLHIIHRHGLTEKEAFIVESSVMDCYDGLSNIQGGYDFDRGVANAITLEERYSAKPYDEPDDINYMIIKITQRVLDERGDIYEATRSAWHINPKNAKKHPYVLSSLYGVVKAVYKVDEWKKCDEREGRWEFDGHPAPKEISDIFVGRRIPDYYKSKGNQNPIAYKKTK